MPVPKLSNHSPLFSRIFQSITYSITVQEDSLTTNSLIYYVSHQPYIKNHLLSSQATLNHHQIMLPHYWMSPIQPIY